PFELQVAILLKPKSPRCRGRPFRRQARGLDHSTCVGLRSRPEFALLGPLHRPPPSPRADCQAVRLTPPSRAHSASVRPLDRLEPWLRADGRPARRGALSMPCSKGSKEDAEAAATTPREPCLYGRR